MSEKFYCCFYCLTIQVGLESECVLTKPGRDCLKTKKRCVLFCKSLFFLHLVLLVFVIVYPVLFTKYVCVTKAGKILIAIHFFFITQMFEGK